MKEHKKQSGFSLTEVLLATAILAMSLVMIAGVFPVAIHLTTIAAERTMSAVISDEAFAKIRLYDVDLSLLHVNDTLDFNDVAQTHGAAAFPEIEYSYPSLPDPNQQGKYYWAALVRRLETANPNLCQVTVFAVRKRGESLRFYKDTAGNMSSRPVPVKVAVGGTVNARRIMLSTPDDIKYFTDDMTIVHNITGDIYRVVEVDPLGQIVLDRDWHSGPTNSFWLIPPPAGGGDVPEIGVFQRLIRFL